MPHICCDMRYHFVIVDILDNFGHVDIDENAIPPDSDDDDDFHEADVGGKATSAPPGQFLCAFLYKFCFRICQVLQMMGYCRKRRIARENETPGLLLVTVVWRMRLWSCGITETMFNTFTEEEN